MRIPLASAFVLLCCSGAGAQELPFRRADANADGRLDWAGGPRVYLPWDLDTVMKQRPHVFTGLAAKYTDVLFTHWEEDYDEVVGDLLSTRLRLETILGEIDRAVRVAGPELDGDPHLAGDSAAATAAEIGGWWTARHAEASAQVASH